MAMTDSERANLLASMNEFAGMTLLSANPDFQGVEISIFASEFERTPTNMRRVVESLVGALSSSGVTSATMESIGMNPHDFSVDIAIPIDPAELESARTTLNSFIDLAYAPQPQADNDFQDAAVPTSRETIASIVEDTPAATAANLTRSEEVMIGFEEAKRDLLTLGTFSSAETLPDSSNVGKISLTFPAGNSVTNGNAVLFIDSLHSFLEARGVNATHDVTDELDGGKTVVSYIHRTEFDLARAAFDILPKSEPAIAAPIPAEAPNFEDTVIDQIARMGLATLVRVPLDYSGLTVRMNASPGAEGFQEDVHHLQSNLVEALKTSGVTSAAVHSIAEKDIDDSSADAGIEVSPEELELAKTTLRGLFKKGDTQRAHDYALAKEAEAGTVQPASEAGQAPQQEPEMLNEEQAATPEAEKAEQTSTKRLPEVTDAGMRELAEKANGRVGYLDYHSEDKDEHTITFKAIVHSSVTLAAASVSVGNAANGLAELFEQMEAEPTTFRHSSLVKDANGNFVSDIEFQFTAEQYGQAIEATKLLIEVQSDRSEKLQALLNAEEAKRQQEAKAKASQPKQPSEEEQAPKAKAPEPEQAPTPEAKEEPRPVNRNFFKKILPWRKQKEGNNPGKDKAFLTDEGFDHTGIDFSVIPKKNAGGHFLEHKTLRVIHDQFGEHIVHHMESITHHAVSQKHGRPTIRLHTGEMLQMVHKELAEGETKPKLSHIVFAHDKVDKNSGAFLLDQLEKQGHSIDTVIYNGSAEFQKNAKKAITIEKEHRRKDLLAEFKELRKMSLNSEDKQILEAMEARVKGGQALTSEITKVLRMDLKPSQAINAIGSTEALQTESNLAEAARLLGIQKKQPVPISQPKPLKAA